MALTRINNNSLSSVTAAGIPEYSGQVLQVQHYSGNNEVSKTRTVGSVISATHSVTKLRDSSTVIVVGYAALRYSAGVNEGWWTLANVKANQGGTTYTSSEKATSSEGQGGTRTRLHPLNANFTSLTSGSVDITVYAQSDGSDWASRGYRITVMEIAGA